MIDLAIDQDNGLNAGISNALSRVCAGEGLQLGPNVWRGIKENPVLILNADRDRGLRSGAGLNRLTSDAGTLDTITVPLRETATCSSAKHSDLHGCDPLSGNVRNKKRGSTLLQSPVWLQAVD